MPAGLFHCQKREKAFKIHQRALGTEMLCGFCCGEETLLLFLSVALLKPHVFLDQISAQALILSEEERIHISLVLTEHQ